MRMPFRSAISALLAIAALLVGFAQSAGAQSFTSDEQPPVICPLNTFVTGITCTGSRCDNVGITCTRPGGASWATGPTPRAYFSDETPGQSNCLPGEAIVGLTCQGSNCDNLSIMCARASGQNFIGCGQTGSVSEENGSLQVPAGEVARGMTCAGRQCDNKTLIACGPASISRSRIIDAGTNPTVRDSMHSCPSGFVVAGVHGDRNDLLCFGPTIRPLFVALRDPTRIDIAPFPVPGEAAINWCGNSHVVTGVHAGRNTFTCMRVSGALGPPTLDRNTVDRGMHACPGGSVLVGIDFPTNRFVCSTFSG